ncbi:MAG: TetR/AcrR family transcriptional regulator [Chloroflexi bacterium]|nr:TetR/AcrR family transcriptional regulator [Chloroflexota bacterium]MDA1270344.1 TetR/AcrR family transcriptional regulator [Chloroflexota bacterium]
MTTLWHESVAGHKRRIEDHIIENALQLISEKGMSGVSMSSLADRAGVSRKTLYNHFPNLEQVVLAWMQAEIEQEYEQIKQGLAGLTDPADKLWFYVTSSLQACADRQHHAGVEAALSSEAAMSHEAWDHISQRFAKTEALLREILQEGVEQGTFRRDIDLNLQTQLIFHLTGSLHDVMAEPDSDPGLMSRAIMDLVLNGISAGNKQDAS